MTRDDPLLRLAEAAGILPGYRDALGAEHRLTPDTASALLAAMGFESDSDDAIEHGIRRIDEAPWRRMLPPVAVLRRGGGEKREGIAVALAAERADETFDWTFTTESGRERHGTMRPADLPLADRRVLDGAAIEKRSLVLPFAPSPGYHRLSLEPRSGGRAESLPVVAAPARCHLPRRGPGGSGHWGLALQLYGLRSERNWGVGDFSDLRRLAETGGRLGAATIALNPLHAMFPERPQHCSPYSPSHRQFLAQHYLDIAAVADFAECDEARRMVEEQPFRERLAALREAALVDYAAVAAAKRPALELLYRSFRERHLNGPASQRGSQFRDYQRRRGHALAEFALFQALSEAHPDRVWPEWPAGYRDPGSPESRDFAAAHGERVEFFQYVQWQAELQLDAAADAARRSGVSLGLYRDLALAPDSTGAEVWAQQDCFAQGVTIGAPPDDWNPLGQSWGLPPYLPEALRQSAYGPFAAMLRANMTEGGALRFDHAMSLERLFWIPPGASPRDGAYVGYPVDDLFAVVALESARAKCLVVGEDLGTLPPGFHDRMRAHGLLSYRLFYFSQDERGAMLPPRRYPALAAVAVGTHDLATLAGYWRGHDLEIRAGLDLFPSEETEAEARARRVRDRRAIRRALERQGLLPDAPLEEDGEATLALVEAVYRYLARTPALLLLLSLEDVLGETEQVNMPGTIDTHPNWRRKASIAVEELWDDPRMQALAHAISAERRSRAGGDAASRVLQPAGGS